MKFMLIIALFTFLFSSFAQEKPEERKVEVIIGIDKTVKLDFAYNRQILNGGDGRLEVIQVPQKRELIFKGVKAGPTASVTVRDKAGDIKLIYLVTVKATDQSKVIQELREFIGDVEGIEVGLKGETVHVSGQIIVPLDIGKVVKVLSLDKFKDVLFLVEISPQTKRLIARKMQEEIQRSGMRNVTVRVVNGKYWLEGIVPSPDLKTKAEQVAKAFLPPELPSLAEIEDAVKVAVTQPIQNFIQVNQKSQPAPIPKMVKIIAQFVELTKDYNKIFGFSWRPLLTDGGGSISINRGNGITTSSEGTLTGTISNLFPKLASAKAAGYARVIQSGILIVKEKIQGTLTKSESKPFAIGEGEFTKSESAKAGFTLNIKPTVLAEEKINLELGLEVSSTIGDPPQTLSNSVQTHLIVKSKESAVVGGIVVNKTSTDYDRNPPGDVQEADDNASSPLFSFVRSKSHTSTRSQFVMFVTPEIIESASQGTDEIKKKFRRRSR
jgi:pilus assembly protein CpaC